MSEQAGKFSATTLKQSVLKKLGAERPEILINAAYGTDTAIIALTDNLGMAVSSDPISLIPTIGLRESALLSVHLTANDIATSGFSAQYAQFVLNLPMNLSERDFTTFWEHIHQYCKSLGIAITGGHTGKIPGQNSTSPGSATMFVTAPIAELLTTQGAKPGNVLIMTKTAAISSTAILAKSFPKTLEDALGSSVVKEAIDSFEHIPVTQEALLAAQTLKKNEELMAMHDVTEGGILGASIEMATACGCGLIIEDEAILVGETQKKIASFFNLDYRKIEGSGSMLMAVDANKASQLIATLNTNAIPAAVIGTFTEDKEHFFINTNSGTYQIFHDEQDPYWEAYFNAYEKGLK